MKLTNDLIEKASPGAKPYRLFDGLGLYIEVATNGTKAWRFKYRFGGKEKRLSLGIFPAVSVEQARIALLKEKKILELGKDPSVERQLKFSENEELNYKLSNNEEVKVERKESGMDAKYTMTPETQEEKNAEIEVQSMRKIPRPFLLELKKFIYNLIVRLHGYLIQFKNFIIPWFKKLSNKIILLISLSTLGIGLLSFILIQHFDIASTSSENNSTNTSAKNFAKDGHQNQVLWTKYLVSKQKNIQFNDDLELKTLVKVWNKQEKNIVIRGYADGRGEKIYNLNLANERAWQALVALKNIGLYPNRIHKIEAIVPQGSESCAAQNTCQEFMKIEINLVN